ncbi:class I SAM-dependent methyltransferase [Modestobacter excelsi]|uniref:class I SAM-dependent methyltransferase n=1 Tax=Modestobacter excelsi TaxID=2213161 RepID=UPI00110C9FB9|nr:class I SAM-dependent methyltransferase [Modestobacter excelsi]
MGGTTAETGSWADGDRYEAYVGRWSRPVARQFVAGLAVPGGGRWVDVGCGTGVLTGTVLDLAEPAAVRAVDRSPSFVRSAAARLPDRRATFVVGDALALPLRDASADAVVSGLVLNFLPDAPAAVGECRRVAVRSAVVAAYVWDHAEGMQLMRAFWDAAARVDPAGAEVDEGTRFPLCAPGPLHRLFSAAGLDDVVTGSVDVPTVFADFDDYWTPFLGGTGPAPAYLATRDEDVRTRIREALRRGLPTRDDGSIALTARASTVRGRVP